MNKKNHNGNQTITHVLQIPNTYLRSYMSAHVLLNSLNELRKSDKMRGLPRILSLFCNEFNKFNNTGAQMLDSIFYHMTLKLLKNRIFGMETSRFCHLLCNVIMEVITLSY